MNGTTVHQKHVYTYIWGMASPIWKIHFDDHDKKVHIAFAVMLHISLRVQT